MQHFITSSIYHKQGSTWYPLQKSTLNVLPRELTNDLRLWILGNWEIGTKLVPSLNSSNKTLAMAVKNFAKPDIKAFGPVQFCLILYFVPCIFSAIAIFDC